MTFVKILITLGILLIMAYPLIPVSGRFRPLFPATALRYDSPSNRKNLPFVLLVLAEFLAAVFVFSTLDALAATVRNIPFVQQLFVSIVNLFSSQIDFILFTLRLVLINLIFLYVFIFAKRILRSLIMEPISRLITKVKEKKKENKGRKDKKKNRRDKNRRKWWQFFKKNRNTDGADKTPAEGDDAADDKEADKNRRVPKFLHSLEGEDGEDGDGDTENGTDTGNADEPEKQDGEQKPKHGRAAAFILGLFFEGEDFLIARPWVIRVRTVLQCFIVLIEILYTLFLLTVLLAMFFPLPMGVYTFLVDTCRIGQWYLYPILSILFLQEICNVFRTPAIPPEKDEEQQKDQDEKEKKKIEARLRKLLSLLKKHFDDEHSLRYYPEAVQEEIKEYEPKNVTYQSALQFIRQRMKKSTGRVVQSYMQCLDACFSDHHVYFASSFYSELGSYLAAYTYIRLMAGSRMIFVVSDPAETATLRTFLSERLMEMTGTSAKNSWRILTPGERLDQADILIVSPGDFRDSSMLTQYPDFFDEACTAVFLDADRMILSDSYLCPLMATRLKKATEGRIRFLFLTQDLYKGFAARSLPKFFCAEPVLAFSSAKENESVSYILWNRESKSHRIYNERGQKTTSLEYMIADKACDHDIDGVRLMTESPIDHAERKLLLDRGAEINKFHRDIVDVNYMVYSDERCNLAASIYACTRFRGQKKSVVHILSKPYLLREYFIARAAKENFVNRSSFIQPRVPEHVDEHKFSLLRLFCELAGEEGLTVTDFETRIRDVIRVAQECGLVISSAFCKRLLAAKDPEAMSTAELAAYLIAGLCDTDVGADADSDAAADASIGHRAKEFYLIFDPAAQQERSTVHRKKYIVFNREREVFDRLFACNEKVTLCWGDEIIGTLDTFPLRTHLEYVAGQSILYQNSEYEIEHISEDGRTLYLRSENVKFSHCLDTVHLRRYKLTSLTPIPHRTGVLNNTRLNLEEIRVTECAAAFTGETYGFYGLSSDKQTLDFYHEDGVDGNPHLAQPHLRSITDGRILKVELQSRIPCTDGMRLLLSAVCNEFIRTLFPKTYRAISIVPVLKEPLPFSAANEPQSETDRIRALYPYLLEPAEEFRETEENRITLLFINDCFEDVGAFQWFYDLSGRYMQEFLANVYSYLHWLNRNPKKKHYIYFGGESLCGCFDLAGCCELLTGFGRVLAEPGEEDIETAGGDVADETPPLCSFCHRPMETGRYSLFDDHRYICADCFEVVDDPKRLEELHNEMRSYLTAAYPDVHTGLSHAQLDPVYSLNADQVLSEFYYRVDLTERTVFVERDNPLTNARVSLLRGMIELWQADNSLINSYSAAQLYYEELIYLCSVNCADSAKWIYGALGEGLRAQVDEIAAFTGIPAIPADASETDTDQAENTADTDDTANAADTESDSAEINGGGTGRTSFDFMREESRKGRSDGDDSEEEFFDDEDYHGLYNPNKVPRFLKRYLRNETADDDREEDVSEAEDPSGDDSASETGDGTAEAKDDASETKDGTAEAKDDASETKDGTAEAKDDASETKDGTAEAKDDTAEAKDDKSKAKDDKSEARDDTAELPEDTAGKKRKKKKRGLFGWGRTPGERMQPVEKDEATNPKIRLYNEIVRHAYDYDTTPISRTGVSDADLAEVYYSVKGDYPELFWLDHGYSYSASTFIPSYRCKNANGGLDTKQIDQKRAEIRRSAKKFTAGISRRTDPYKALLTIYRRLILLTDYDSIGLQKASYDVTKDDPLRSLYSALVDHKVVCAGYAAAMQYLMQSVGIVSAYIISECKSTGNECHAFNVLKIGKFCYYLDATWGDYSNTQSGDKYREWVLYDHFCAPQKEFLQVPEDSIPMHKPRREYYPRLETFRYVNHEYFRYHKAYLPSYNEEEIVRIIADAAKAYDRKEMGEFVIGIRTPSRADAEVVIAKLLASGNLSRLIGRAKDSLKKREKERIPAGKPAIWPSSTGAFYIRFQ